MTISDIAACVQACAALVALWYAFSTVEESKKQAIDARENEKKWKTIEACERYDTDPILDFALRSLRAARLSKALDKRPEKYKTDITTVLNYLDGIAISVLQGVLVESLVRDHIGGIVNSHVERYILSGLAERAGIELSNYRNLIELDRRFSLAADRDDIKSKH